MLTGIASRRNITAMRKSRWSPADVVDLLVRKHGRDTVLEMLAAFRAGSSPKPIAAKCGVSRQEVWRWRKALGVEVRSFQVHREVEALLRGGAPPSRV